MNNYSSNQRIGLTFQFRGAARAEAALVKFGNLNIKFLLKSVEALAAPDFCVTDSCYASANIKALETLGYAEHICNYLVI